MSVSARTPDDHADQATGLGRVAKPRPEQPEAVPEVRRSRGLPFAQVITQWVRDPRYSANLRTLYAILVTYADVRARDTSKGQPYRAVLAAGLGVSESTLDRTIREGEAAGLFRVEHRTNAKTRSADANVYHLFDADFLAGEWTDPLRPDQNAADVAEAARKRRAEAKKAAGILPKGGRKKTDPTKNTAADLPKDVGGVMGDATPGSVENRGGGVMGDAVKLLDLDPLVENQGRDLSLSPLDLHLTNRAGAVDSEREIADPSTGNAPQASQEPRTGPSAPSGPPDPTDAVLAAYEAAAGRSATFETAVRLRDDARVLLVAGCTVEFLAARAAEMPAHGWLDLAKHVERFPLPAQRAAEPTSSRPALPECRECERPVAGDPVDGLCRDCRTDRKKPAELCFFCENTERPGWRYDADGDLVECDHVDEYASN